VTSIADTGSERRRGALRTIGLLLLLAFGVLTTPMPWGWLWLAVPGAVALSLLLCWRFGGWGVLVPVALQVATVAATGPFTPWVWWIPVGSLAGAWMGLREEAGGPDSGQRAWMLLPVLLLAVALPWTLGYTEMVERGLALLAESAKQRADLFRQMGYAGERLATLERESAAGDAMMRKALPHALPTLLFLWMAFLVSAGRGIAARIGSWTRWPELSRRPFRSFRLPDGALWLMMLGMALLVAEFDGWQASGWTLVVVPALGFCLQGVAVVESLMLARGVPPAIIALTVLFVVIVALPVFVLAAASVGVSDIWLDYRRLEAQPDGDEP
jgi:hypothetical protein